MVIQRGEIWWTDGPDPRGSEPGFRRPMVVVQSDSFNRSAIRTVVAVAVTSNVRLADAPGNVLIPKRSSGLPRDSVVNVSQVSTVDRTRLTEKVRTLPASVMSSIDRGLRLVLDL
jgi:mRNA interferase MazF